MPRPSILLLILTTICPPICAIKAEAADESEVPDVAVDVEQLPVRLLVLDPEGEPVVGAKITPIGMRTRVERGSHYGWVPQRHGQRPEVLTEADGRATIMVPKHVVETLEIGEVTWQIEHDDFILFREDVDVEDDPGTVTLKRGRRIAISAVSAETGERITTDLHAMLSGGGSGNEWQTNSAGLLMSKSVAPERRLLRIVHAPEDGPVLFSEVIDLNENGDALRVLLRDIKLHPAVRLSGRLHDDVPRPVQNGTVSLNIIDHVGEERDWEARLYWTDWAKVREDGTFEFSALPAGSLVQLIGLCDGWVNALPTEQDFEALGADEDLRRDALSLRSSRIMPQLVKLTQPENTSLLRMVKTASVKVTVLDPGGKPLPGAQVYTNPNQIWIDGGSQIVGNGSSMLAALRMTDEQLKLMDDWSARQLLVELGVRCPGGSRYQQVTDENGVAIMPSIPAGTPDIPRDCSLQAVHDDFEQPIVDPVRMERSITVNIPDHQQVEVVIRMEEKKVKSDEQ